MFWTHGNNKPTKDSELLDNCFSQLFSFSESFYCEVKVCLPSVFKDNLVSET